MKKRHECSREREAAEQMKYEGDGVREGEEQKKNTTKRWQEQNVMMSYLTVCGAVYNVSLFSLS